jgi:hypothetical protein
MDRRQHTATHAKFSRRAEDLIHIDFGDRPTVPAELLDDDEDRIPQPIVYELHGEPARRAFLEAVQQQRGRP